MSGRRYSVERGAYVGTSDDRYDRWYLRDEESRVVDRRGQGYATRAEARAAADDANERAAQEVAG